MADPAKQRANLGFGDALDELNPDAWSTSTAPPAPVPEEQLRAVAEASGFQSREVRPAAAPKSKSQRRTGRVHRTGRSFQLNMKIREEDRDRFYNICDQEAWVLGFGFQRAIEALERELGIESLPEKSKKQHHLVVVLSTELKQL